MLEDWFYYTVAISIVVSTISRNWNKPKITNVIGFAPNIFIARVFANLSRCQIWNCLTLQRVKATDWIIYQMTGFLLRKNWSLLVYSWANVSYKQWNYLSDFVRSTIYFWSWARAGVKHFNTAVFLQHLN